jgi:hypothetical protein
MNFKLSKPRNFKNIEGQYCFVNDPLQFTFHGTVVFDVDTNNPKPNIFIYNTKSVEEQLEKIKDSFINQVHSQRFFNVSKENLQEYYVNPIKKVKKGKKLVEAVKLKLATFKEPILKKTKVCLEISISSIWMSIKAFGVYLNVVNVNIPENPKKCLLLESDSESEIDLNI